MTDWGERIRAELVRRVVPIVQAEGVRRVFLPQTLGAPQTRPPLKYCPRYPHPPHAGPELICFVSGFSPVWVGDCLYRLGEGDILLMPPGSAHAPGARACRALGERPLPNAPAQIPLTFFPFGASVGFAQTSGEILLAAPGVFHADRHLLATADTLVAELTDRRTESALVAQGLLLEILGRVLRAPALPGLQHALSPTPPQPDTSPSDVASRAREYVHRHYDRPVSLSEIARHLGVSQSHLSRAFRQSTGTTVVSYLTQVRLTAARRLLEAGLSVTRVAELVGIPDPYYFSRVFRRAYGFPPSKSRGRRETSL